MAASCKNIKIEVRQGLSRNLDSRVPSADTRAKKFLAAIRESHEDGGKLGISLEVNLSWLSKAVGAAITIQDFNDRSFKESL